MILTTYVRVSVCLSIQAKSEERSQALAMLMLQYCAGLQNCTEAVEHETYQL